MRFDGSARWLASLSLCLSVTLPFPLNARDWWSQVTRNPAPPFACGNEISCDRLSSPPLIHLERTRATPWAIVAYIESGVPLVRKLCFAHIHTHTRVYLCDTAVWANLWYSTERETERESERLPKIPGTGTRGEEEWNTAAREPLCGLTSPGLALLHGCRWRSNANEAKKEKGRRGRKRVCVRKRGVEERREAAHGIDSSVNL